MQIFAESEESCQICMEQQTDPGAVHPFHILRWGTKYDELMQCREQSVHYISDWK